MSNIYLYDCEIFINYFCVTFKDVKIKKIERI